MPTQRLAAFLFAIVMSDWCASPLLAYQREIQAVADSIGEKLAASGKRSVAVVDFTDLQGNVTELGRFLAEELSVALASASRPLEVVDRTHLKVLLQEHKLSTTGLIDPATAKKLGQIAGVDGLMTGTLTPFGDTVRLTLKVLDTSTARIVAASTAEIAKTKAIEELVARGVGGSSGGAVSASSSASGPPAALPSSAGMPKPLERRGIRFTLKRCTLRGDTVSCQLVLENVSGEAVKLAFVAHSSYLYDATGSQYQAEGVSIGNRQSSSEQVIPGIPLAAAVSFRGIPDEAVQVSLSLVFWWGYDEQLVFRNVTLAR